MQKTEEMLLRPIGRVVCPLKEKFGLPRQSGLASHLTGEIELFPPYDQPESFRGIEMYSHLWILWGFSSLPEFEFSPTVRPPRLGGNRRVGVFATRSPFRPNPIGLTVVRFLGLEKKNGKTVLKIAGLDMQDGTPVYDIKPYIPYADALPNASGGFAEEHKDDRLMVIFDAPADRLTEEEKRALEEILSLDPRPAYQEDPERLYGMSFGSYGVKFRVEGQRLIVCSITQDEKE